MERQHHQRVSYGRVRNREKLMADVRLVDTAGPDDAAQDIADRIRTALSKNQTVLWLVSGGSAIAVAVQARRQLGQLQPNERLIVSLVDERFVPMGHTDSNWQQLISNGFDMSGTQTYPMLEVGVTVETIVTTYDRLLRDLLNQANYRIGLFGIGADGHTGGLLPHNPVMSDENQLVGHFKGPDYERITVTPALVRKLDDKVVYVLGEQKWPAIASMLKDGPVDEIPARILTKNGNVTIFTDYKGEPV